jgi:hypothetical protein
MAKDTSKTPPVVVVNNQKSSTPSRVVDFQIQDGKFVADTDPGVKQ